MPFITHNTERLLHFLSYEQRGVGLSHSREQGSFPVDESRLCCLASVGKTGHQHVLEQSGEIMSMETAKGVDSAHENGKCPWEQEQLRECFVHCPPWGY